MDFSEKPQVDISSIAGVLQRKAQMQAQMDQQAQQQKMQMIQEAVQGATQTVSTLVQQSKDKQKADFVKSLGDAMAAQVPQLNQTLPQQGPGLPDNSVQTPSGVLPGEVSDRTSQFMPGTPGQVGTSSPGVQALPPVQTQVPDIQKQNAIRAAVALNPDQASQDVLKANTPNTGAASMYELKVGQDGQLYRVSKANPNDVQPVGGANGFTTNAVTADQRKAQLGVAQQNANTRQENADTNSNRFVSVTGNKFADATDPTKMTDYSRLTAAKRLGVFADQVGDKAIGIQVKEAAGMLASIMQGGGKGGVVAEKLIDQLTPSTLKGSAATKLQWLEGHPESVDQGEFLKMFKQTADREATAAENNIRQHQADAVNKYGKKVKSLDQKRYNDVMNGIGFTEDNIGPDGSFIRTPGVRAILPDYNPAGAAGQGTQIPGLPKGFTYTVQ